MSRTWAINSKLGFHSCIKAEHHKIRADYFEQRRWISFSVSSKFFSAVNLRRVNLQLLGGLGVVKKQSLAHWDLEQKQRLTLAALSSCCCYETSEDQLEAHSGECGTIFTFYWVWGGGSESCRGYSVKIHQQKSCNRLPLHNHTARDFTNVRLVG